MILGGDGTQAQEAYDEIAKSLSGTVALRAPLPHDGATYATLFDGLIVLNEVPVPDGDPYDWSPLPQDQKGNGAITNWFELPWGGPDFIILPSFHTAAERAMKKQNSEPGQEMFLTVCGLMANGADDPAQPLADGRADEPRSGSRIRSGAAARDGRRGLAAQPARGVRKLARSGTRAARAADGARRAAEGREPVFLGRLHAGRHGHSAAGIGR